MSGLGSQMLEVMSKNALWVRILGSSSIMEPDQRARFADRIKKATERLQNVDSSALALAGAGLASSPASAANLTLGIGMSGLAARSGRRRRDAGATGASDELTKGAQACCELAIEQCKGHASQMIKDLLFNYIRKQEGKMNTIQTEAYQQQTAVSSSAMQIDG